MSQATVSAAIAEPYAEALMSLGQEQNLTQKFGEDVGFLLGLLQSSPDLQQFLANPFVQGEDKKAVLRQVAGAEIHSYMLQILLLLVDRRRISFLAGICKQYQARLRKLNNAVLAEVTSCVSLTEAQSQAIVDKVKAMTGASQVELEVSTDPDLIGGVIIKVGSQVLDASIRGQLRRISNSLLSAA
ncbi:MAG: F0F1 ATP synthase subunit delta [Aphanocapsa sp. GSE-SYN-MK-11-07L]|jgi:F-type H+-transporting ATPase subunit delta|nr:F0F1 ATP synthase subunit delta [Aphanocapsa sp. GSE-SYN-MK-11-07L]